MTAIAMATAFVVNTRMRLLEKLTRPTCVRGGVHVPVQPFRRVPGRLAGRTDDLVVHEDVLVAFLCA